MLRSLLLAFVFLSAGLGRPAAAQAGADGLPPRPAPFRFVNDQAQLLAPADAKKLEGGLRRYADNTGTQVVVVTVPSLGGRDVADYGRALGTAWGVGQRAKNNGVVVLVSAQDHKVTVQPGSGLAGTITPAVTSRIIGQMTPSFKQGNYFAGLRTGLNTLMLTANPSSNPRKDQPSSPQSAAADAGPAALGAAAGPASAAAPDNLGANNQSSAPSGEPVLTPPVEPASSGPGLGTLLLGALVVGGILWLVVKMLRGRGAAATPAAPNAAPGGTAPDFLPNRPTGPAGGYGQAPGNYGGPAAPSSGGMMGGGMGGMLATGAAAAAGAYLGNRMASGHDTSGSNLANDGASHHPDGAGLGAAGAGAAGTGAAGDYFSSRDGGTADNSAPDYFSADETANNSSSDYFSSDDNSSLDDTSSADTGGGGFDGDSGGSGSW